MGLVWIEFQKKVFFTKWLPELAADCSATKVWECECSFAQWKFGGMDTVAASCPFACIHNNMLAYDSPIP